ncbi:MAG TPA: hypothetical protein VFQ76_06470 [Longimicrobiaceae bacterium]|nr:hypothetical protein [Longimicrobiaceae bacterium]
MAGAAGRAAGGRARRQLVAGAREIVENAPRGDEIAERIATGAGIPGGKLGPAREAARRELARISETAYRPLEEAHPVIQDPTLRTLLRSPEIVPAARKVMGVKAVQQKAAPSFKELQQIRNALTSRATRNERAGDWHAAQMHRDAAQRLTDAMEKKLPGYTDANAQWKLARRASSAFDEGYTAGGKANVEQIEQRLAALPEGAARDHFRRGMASRVYDQLATKGGRVTLKDVQRLQSAGMSAKLRMMFRDEAAYREFMADLERPGQAFADAQLAAPDSWLKRVGWKTLGAAAAGAAGYGGVRSLFDTQ